MRAAFYFVAAAALAIASLAAMASEPPSFDLLIKDHRFQPAEITIPAGQKVKLRVKNQDATPEEFESYTLNREKVVAGGSEIIVWIGPLDPGEHQFFGDFNQATAQGRLIVK